MLNTTYDTSAIIALGEHSQNLHASREGSGSQGTLKSCYQEEDKGRHEKVFMFIIK